MTETFAPVVGRLARIAMIAGAIRLPAAAATGAPATRAIDVDIAKATKPLDRFFDLSVGLDYSGTLIRDDAQGQLNPAVDDELYDDLLAKRRDVLLVTMEPRAGAAGPERGE